MPPNQQKLDGVGLRVVTAEFVSHASISLTAAAVLLLATSHVFAWGSQGHAHITTGSVAHLPQPLRSFFQTNVSTISQQAANEPPGRHYIDIDVYPEFFANTFPHDVNVLIAKYDYNYVEGNGMGPWTYDGYVQSLTTLMTAARTKQDWLNLISTAAAQAHYIEDMHNPLHVTANYNGQLTGNTGIHSRYETSMVNSHLGDLTFVTTPATFETSIIDDVFAGIYDRYPHVSDIMAADTTAISLSGGSYNSTYYASLWDSTGTFTHELIQEASEAVANGWYTAWVNAGSPIPNLGLNGDYNGNNVIDAADYVLWRDAMNTPGATLMNDSTPASVTAADYQYWRTRFGQSIGSGTGFIAVPEPRSSLIAATLIAIGGLIASRCGQTHSIRPAR